MLKLIECDNGGDEFLYIPLTTQLKFMHAHVHMYTNILYRENAILYNISLCAFLELILALKVISTGI